MGDDELNFTAQEASEWASDPRNQAHQDALIWPLLLVFFLVCVVFLLILIYWPATSGGSGKSVPLAIQPAHAALTAWCI